MCKESGQALLSRFELLVALDSEGEELRGNAVALVVTFVWLAIAGRKEEGRVSFAHEV